MRMPYDLYQLGEIRAQGRSPGLPVMLSAMGGEFAQNLTAVGAVVIPIWHESPEWDWSPLAGLAVLIVPRETPDWLWALFQSVREARPRWVRVYDSTAPMGERITALLA